MEVLTKLSMRSRGNDRALWLGCSSEIMRILLLIPEELVLVPRVRLSVCATLQSSGFRAGGFCSLSYQVPCIRTGDEDSGLCQGTSILLWIKAFLRLLMLFCPHYLEYRPFR